MSKEDEVIELIQEFNPETFKIASVNYEEKRYIGITLYLQDYSYKWYRVDLQIYKGDIQEIK